MSNIMELVKMKRRITGAIMLVVLLSLLPAASGCAADVNTDTPSSLEAVEIRDYEGTRLSSVDDFRENSIKGPQRVDIESYELGIAGLVDNPMAYAYGEVVDGYAHCEKIVTLNCVEGWSATILWEGVLVRDLITDSEPLPSATTVIFHAYDGYTTSFPIEYIMNEDIIMAYKMNGLTLPVARGFPFQLVAESKWGYKWIKWITEIELSDDIDYRGYWERRGYSNTGDLDESFLEK